MRRAISISPLWLLRLGYYDNMLVSHFRGTKTKSSGYLTVIYPRSRLARVYFLAGAVGNNGAGRLNHEYTEATAPPPRRGLISITIYRPLSGRG